jgi:hypothetical protein
MSDFITPPTRYPFRPGEAVYFLPATHRMTAPPPRIRGVVLSANDYTIYIKREDGCCAAVKTANLAYAAFCPHCDAPAVMTKRGRLVCPGCGGPVIEQPLPDEMVLLRFLLDFGWYTSMTMRRAILNPNWSYRQAIVDRAATIDSAVQRMLRRLGLAKPAWRSNNGYRAVEHLRYYAMLEHEAAFLATYYELLGQPAAFVPLAT